MEVDQEVKEITKSQETQNFLRARLREELLVNRDLQRSTAFDKNRFLENEIFSVNEVVGICGRIKRRKNATEEDLIRLATAFYQSEINISAFVKITGAINVIIKEFIGHTERQILAAQVLCNLSLGSDGCCAKIATFAGAYLMIYIRNFTHVALNKICIWTLQNCVSSTDKSIDILMSQELLPNTLNIVANAGDVELQHEAMKLLDLIMEKKWTSFGIDEKDEVAKIVLNYVKLNPTDGIGLQSLHRVANSSSENINRQEFNSLLLLLSKNIIEMSAQDDPHTIYMSIKIISIIFKSDPQILDVFLENLINSSTKLSLIINETAKNPKFFILMKGFLRLVSEIYHCQQPVAAKYLAFDDVVNNLVISKIFEF